MLHLLIDTDTASDDAVALVMALRAPEARVEAITVVAGNVPLAQGVQNALYTVELCGATVPVHAGAVRPLLRPLETAQFVHGEDGMGDIGLPLSGRSPAPGHAVEAILAASHRLAGELVLVTLGPLTNLALALAQDPTLAARVRRCVVMGGVGYGHGNVTPVAEYNVWVDPEAAKIVFDAGLPLTMVGWDAAHQYACLDPDEAARLRAVGTPLAAFCVDIQRTLVEFCVGKMALPGFDLPDPLAVAVALDPTLVTRSLELAIAVETGSALCRGQTVVDHLGIWERPPNATVVREVSRERFLARLHAAVRV